MARGGTGPYARRTRACPNLVPGSSGFKLESKRTAPDGPGIWDRGL